jgi:hypothetical protein
MAASVDTSPTHSQPHLKYEPLDSLRNQLRLITFETSTTFPTPPGPQPLHCKVDAYSLDQFTEDYEQYLSTLSKDLSTTEVFEGWIARNQAKARDTADFVQNEIFTRFTWGDFAAISHTWGDRTLTDVIFVNGQAVSVPANLGAGLRALSRQPEISGGQLKVWNDMLCLNQSDKKEIHREVKRMGDIFGGSYQVMSWLGPAANDSDEAIWLANQIDCHGIASKSERNISSSATPHAEAMVTDSAHRFSVNHWKAVGHFLQRPYWRRLWVLQELILAKSRTIVICGDKRTSMQAIFSVVRVMCANPPPFHHWFLLSGFDQHQDRNIFSVSSRLCYLDCISYNVMKGKGGELSQLLDLCRGSEQALPQDKVYGILGLLDKAVADDINPDLDKDHHGVYRDLVHAVYSATHFLDILQSCRLGSSPKHPTWTPDLTVKSLVHTLGTRNLIHAGGSSPADDVVFSEDGMLLTCKAFNVGTIDGLTGPTVQPRSNISAYGGDGAILKSALWQTLVGSSAGGNHDTAAPSGYACLLDLPWPADVSKDDLVEHGWCNKNETRDLERFLKFRIEAAQFSVFGRKLRSFFPCELTQYAKDNGVDWIKSALRQAAEAFRRRRLVTTTEGWLGVAPEQAQRGDMVVVVLGCSAPIVLRPIGGSRLGDRYMVVGDCYVHGLMKGELVDGELARKYNLQDVVLC